MGSVILYEQKRRIWLTLDGGAFINRNMAMHNPDFLVFKDSQTEVEFVVRNVDRKPIDLTGRKMFVTLVDYHTAVTLAVVPLEVVDAKRGIARLTFLPYMVKDIKLGFHRYVVSYQLDNGNAKLLNTDQYERVSGFFEIRYGRELQGIQSQHAEFSEFYPDKTNRFDTVWITPNFKGNLQNGSLIGLHTFVFSLVHWTGKVTMEGAIVSETPKEIDWFPLLIDEQRDQTYVDRSGLCAYNLNANLQWIRFKFVPDIRNNGEIKKVSLRH